MKQRVPVPVAATVHRAVAAAVRVATDLLEIRTVASEADVRVIAPLFDAYRVFYEQPSDAQASLGFLLERWQQRESVIFVADENGTAVGFTQLYPFFTSVRIGRMWLLNDLYVDAGARHGGVGRALMRRAEAHARDTGAHGIMLSTAHTNTTAQALYESEGYVLDTVYRYYEKLV